MKLNFKKIYFSVIVAALALVAALFFQYSPNRTPASIPEQNFFQLFKPESAVNTALHNEIISSLKVAKSQKNYQIQIRNFLVKDSANHDKANRESLCGYFSDYKLTFEAEGIASNGERPTLVIHQPCVVSEITKVPNPILIPTDDIFKLKPSDTDISFKASQNTIFSFKNIYESWPEYWVLSKIEFDSEIDPSRNILIERKEIFQNIQKPIVMDWAPF